MERNSRQAARFLVVGRVQGVGFRYSTSRRASSLGLTGYVRNRADGSVEVWAEGNPDGLKSLAEWLERGPSMARVERVERSSQTPTNTYRRFGISG